MTRGSFLQRLFALAVCAVTFTPLHAAPTLTEKEKIEALIAGLEAKTDATFIRNGSEYDAKSAAKFLRGKWRAHGKEIKTAKDFIDKAASVSSTSSKPYEIRWKDGTRVRCGDYLAAQLLRLQSQ